MVKIETERRLLALPDEPQTWQRRTETFINGMAVSIAYETMLFLSLAMLT